MPTPADEEDFPGEHDLIRKFFIWVAVLAVLFIAAAAFAISFAGWLGFYALAVVGHYFPFILGASIVLLCLRVLFRRAFTGKNP